jgi:hypothetical protein
LDHLTSPGLAYSQILLAWIYEPLVLVNTMISWIRLAYLNPCTTIFLFRSGIAFYFHLFSTGHSKAKQIYICVCLRSHVKKKKSSRLVLIFFLLSAKPEIVVPGSGFRFRYFIFRNFRWTFICWSNPNNPVVILPSSSESADIGRSIIQVIVEAVFSTFFALNFDKMLAVE